MRKIIYLILLLFMGTTSWAGEQVWCVFEPLSSKGDISRRLQDIRFNKDNLANATFSFTPYRDWETDRKSVV